MACELRDVARQLARAQDEQRSQLDAVDPAHREGALNLSHYVALRRLDVRGVQRRLAERGLSSLGRCEPHVWATLQAVREVVGVGADSVGGSGPSFEEGRRALDVNTDSLLGPRPPGRVPRIMVTLPSQAARDPGLVLDLAQRGMDVARVNGAHDTPQQWVAMARNVAAAGKKLGRAIPVSFDLPGPKLRTGAIQPGPPVRRFRPERDLRGVAIAPARLSLTSAADASDPSAVPVTGAGLDRLRPGDQITLHDTRGSPRRLMVTEAGGDQVAVEAWDTTYLESRMTLSCGERTFTVGELTPLEQYHVLRPGDRLRVVADERPVPAWRPGTDGEATIGCTLPAAAGAVHRGDRVALDDGRIAGVVETAEPDGFTLRVEVAHPAGSRLRSDKSINVPHTHLPVPMLSEADHVLLEIAARHGDLLGLSFIRHEDDLDMVIHHLNHLGASQLGLILKVETVPAFQRLPEILMRAMRWRRVGIMIARGDLAVEASYERLAEVQEEILWLAEAAHLPVVWATEVLDRLARTGHPTRAEITDAAMAQRAECVMLNKGPYVDLAITALDDILKRMAGHQRKKTALLRPLHAWNHTD
jgi:pyruvate kinase